MNISVNWKSDNLRRFSLILPYLAILSVCGIAYLNAFTHGFLLDDYVHLIGQVTLNDISFLHLYTEGYQGFYRPFAFMFLKVMLAIFGQNAMAYHVYNFVLFYILCALFYQILLRFRLPQMLALTAVLFYAAHPINNFLVNYKTAGNNTIFMICMQIAFLCYLHFLDAKSRPMLGLSLVVFFLALISHEITFMLPIYIFLVGYYVRGQSAVKMLSHTVMFAIPFVIYLIIRSQVLTQQPLSHFLSAGIPAIDYGKVLIKLMSWYVSKLIYPQDLIFLWDERIAGVRLNWYEIVCGVAAIAMAVVLIVKRHRNVFSFAYLLFLVGLMPLVLAGVTYSPRFATAIIEPHWFGFSSIGFFVLIAGVLGQLNNIIGEKGFWGLVILMVFLFAAITRRENAMWQNERTYCEYWLRTNGLNGTPWNCWADANIHEKEEEINKTSGECSDLALMGFSYHIRADIPKAIQYYQTALQNNNQCVPALYGAALLFDDLNERVPSNKFLNDAKRIKNSYFPVYLEVKRVFDNTHEKESAVRIIKMLRKIRGEE